MRYAYLAVSPRQEKARPALEEGLFNIGCELVQHAMHFPYERDSIAVIWNMHKPGIDAGKLIQAGGLLFVCENPYIKYDKKGNEYVAMALNGHNGSGFLVPEEIRDYARLARFGIDFKPWRESGSHILVVGQRGIGSSSMRSPPLWGEKMVEELQQRSDRPIVYRSHPGQKWIHRTNPPPPLEEQLKNCHAMVMWASNCATTALAMGIPVFYSAPHCMLEEACLQHPVALEDPLMGDREPVYRKLAWHQWNLGELASGYAYEVLETCYRA